MRRRGLLAPGRIGSLSWSLGNEPAGSIQYQMTDWAMTLIYRWRDGSDGEWCSVREPVSFAFTDQRLGGRRRWFLCPRCHRRCAVLYGGAHFRCRRCQRLAYQSQQQAPMWRVLEQAQKLRIKLGGSGSMDEAFPDKPKGMHWRTYDRICRKAEWLESRVAALEGQWLSGMMRAFGIGPKG